MNINVLLISHGHRTSLGVYDGISLLVSINHYSV